jgi:putative PIN family toxin of toxin-antitoxin system
VRLFFDTNVFISAFIARGICAELYETVSLEHELIVGEPVEKELCRILTEKLHVPPAKISRIRAELGPHEFAPESAVQVSFPDDPADKRILACALAANADAFVTGDKAILAWNEIEGRVVCSPHVLWLKLTSG